MISTNRFYPYLKLFWTPNGAPFAAFARGLRTCPSRHAEQVCPRLTWLMTYLKKPAPPSTSPICWPASSPPYPWLSIARAWSPPSPKRSPVATVSCAPPRTLSACARMLDDSVGGVSGDCRRLAPGVPPTAHFSARRTAGARLVGLPGTPLLVPHPLDLGWSESQLERGILSPLALPVATPGFVCSHSAPRSGLLPWTLSGRGHR